MGSSLETVVIQDSQWALLKYDGIEYGINNISATGSILYSYDAGVTTDGTISSLSSLNSVTMVILPHKVHLVI